MSATQLAEMLGALAAAAILGLAAGLLVWAAKPGQRARFGTCAIGLGMLACGVLGVGYAASRPPAPPGQAPAAASSRCQPGTYDNGGVSDDGPVCVPWPAR